METRSIKLPRLTNPEAFKESAVGKRGPGRPRHTPVTTQTGRRDVKCRYLLRHVCFELRKADMRHRTIYAADASDERASSTLFRGVVNSEMLRRGHGSGSLPVLQSLFVRLGVKYAA